MAHGGLTHAEPKPRSRESSLLHDGVEDDQEIEVECVPTHDRGSPLPMKPYSPSLGARTLPGLKSCWSFLTRFEKSPLVLTTLVVINGNENEFYADYFDPIALTLAEHLYLE
jgi:hypothetical protein